MHTFTVVLFVVNAALVVLNTYTFSLFKHSRRPAEQQQTPRERLLERDIVRLQTSLDEAHRQLLHVMGHEYSLTPAELDRVRLAREAPDDPVEEDDGLLRYADVLGGVDEDLLTEPPMVESAAV